MDSDKAEKNNLRLETKRIIRTLETLPTLPKVATQAFNLLTDGEPDIDEVIKLIEADQALTLKILKLVNAACFGLSSPVTSIKKAVVLLGFSEVRCILLSTTVADSITKSFHKGSATEQNALWKHALASAVCAEMLIGETYPELKAEAFVSGLLHDVGKLVLEVCFPEKIAQLETEENTNVRLAFKVEEENFGADHCTVGKWLAENWKLPEIYTQSIWLHHHPFRTIAELDFLKNRQVTLAVRLADILSHSIMADCYLPSQDRGEVTEMLKFLGIKKPGFLEHLSSSLGKHFSERAHLLDFNEDELQFYYQALQRANLQLAKIAFENAQYRGFKKINDELTVLHDLYQNLSSADNAETILDEVARTIAEKLERPEGVVYFLNMIEKRLVGCCWSHEGESRRFSLPTDEQGKIIEHENKDIGRDYHWLISMRHTRSYDPWRPEKELMLVEGHRPLVILPLMSAGYLIGEIAIIEKGDDTGERIETDRQNIYKHLAVIAETALSRVKVTEELKGTAESLSAALSKNEEVLRRMTECNREYENLFEYSTDAIVFHRGEGKIERVNQRASALTGYSEQELINCLPLQGLLAGIRGASESGSNKKDQREGETYETQLQQKSGKIIDVEINSRTSYSDASLVQTFIRDITYQKQTAKALCAEKERLSVTLRSIGDGVITADAEGTIVLMNKVAETLTGWTQDQAIGKPIMEVFHLVNGKTREDVENPVYKVVATGKIMELPNHMILIDRQGNERDIADSTAPIIDGFNKIIGVVLVFRDITYKKKIEEEALKAQKFESIGVLAGGMAHDFNNILTAISGNVSLAKRHLKPEDKAFDNLTKAERACQRAMDLTEQLLTFAKGGLPIKKSASVAEMVKESAEFVLRGSNVRCQFSISEDLWEVEVDEGQINQVINNLLINADQAMPEGGIMNIAAANVSLQNGTTFPFREGDYVKISIADQGVGIPKEDIPKIFDPYFTTKQTGNGLGLAMAYSIIKRHDGYLNVESQVGLGTTFSIFIPASKNMKVLRTHEQDKPINGRGRILVMDDEQEIRDITAEMLKSIGYDMEAAKDGMEAIERYTMASKSKHPFDLVIIDLTVPGGMGGKEAIQKLREIDPEVKAVVSSGYTNDPVLTDFDRFGFIDVITKPFNISELSKILYKTIGNGTINRQDAVS